MSDQLLTSPVVSTPASTPTDSTSPTSPVAPTDPSQPKQDPLAVLQDILAQAKNKSGGKTGQTSPVSAGDLVGLADLGQPPIVNSEPAVDPAVEATQKAEQAAKLAEAKAAEEAENLRKQQELEQQIIAQKAVIAQEMQTSTQEKARLEQKQEEADANQTGISSDPGFMIHQISHDKAQV